MRGSLSMSAQSSAATDLKLRAVRRAGQILKMMAERGERARGGGDIADKSSAKALFLFSISASPRSNPILLPKWRQLARLRLVCLWLVIPLLNGICCKTRLLSDAGLAGKFLNIMPRSS
jgi:hypothetical protein